MFESMRMLTLRRVVFTAAFGVMLASCSGVYGPKGNDAGGIIPWNPENEDNAMLIAQQQCGSWGKHAVFTTVDRMPGGHISYACRYAQHQNDGGDGLLKREFHSLSGL